MLAMAKIDSIRKAYFEEGRSISEVSRLEKADRKTVRKYVERDDFNCSQHKQSEGKGTSSKLEPFKPVMRKWLEEDKQFRRKQRHTARRVYDRLCTEQPEFNSSYRSVAECVREMKGELYRGAKPSLPLLHIPGEAQADFGEAEFFEHDRRITGKYLNLSFPYSNAGYMQLGYGENLECLLEGLRRIFEHIGGVPSRIWFDNASSIVTKVLKDGHRDLTERFIRFRQHYGFECSFCNPASGNEKGNVENKVGYHRRNFLVPAPRIENLDGYNQRLLSTECAKDMDRPHYMKGETIAELHKEDIKKLIPLPSVSFDCAKYETRRLDNCGKFKITENHTYSVSPKYAGGIVTIKITAAEVIPLDESGRAITRHKRLYGAAKQESMNWPLYLEQLSRSPGAFKYSGIYSMMPDQLRAYLERQEKGDRGKTLRTIASLAQQDGFENAVKSVNEAVMRNVKSLDSLIALHGYLLQQPIRETMWSGAIKETLPTLPGVKFSAETYDAFMMNSGLSGEISNG